MKNISLFLCALALSLGVVGCKEDKEPIQDYKCSDIQNIKDKSQQDKMRMKCGMGVNSFHRSNDKGW
ncbi:entry exclusion lipoprotein TrbK [Pseudomonas duriflava]|uniref:entry exclusion lipoprotein TrbK n=1 Tax=Pseudomonas duriflava TaxID=459528 RepID=UPI0011A36417